MKGHIRFTIATSPYCKASSGHRHYSPVIIELLVMFKGSLINLNIIWSFYSGYVHSVFIGKEVDVL